MSRINGEKARASIQRRRRTAQRAKDRAALAAAKIAPPAPPKIRVRPPKPAPPEPVAAAPVAAPVADAPKKKAKAKPAKSE